MPKCTLIRTHKRRWRILTVGRWPWKSETAKKCVTTYLPNAPALKMDGAQAYYLYSAHDIYDLYHGVEERNGCDEAYWVTGSEASISADLGGSSKYSSENLEGRSGERFHKNSN